MDEIGTTCPACGAQLSISPSEKHIHCTYCGNEFDVNLSGVNPDLKVTHSSREMPDVPPPPLEKPDMPAFLSQPPATQPPEPEFISPTPQPAEKPGFSIPGLPKIAQRSLWAIIAILVGVALCVIFGCMVLVFVIRSFGS